MVKTECFLQLDDQRIALKNSMRLTTTENGIHQKGVPLLNLHGKDFNNGPIDDQLAILGLHCALELAMGGVVLEQVRL